MILPFICLFYSSYYDRRWQDPSFIIPTHPTSTSCVKITPDQSPSYVHDDPLPEPRSMANFLFLPNGKIVCMNGALLGSVMVNHCSGFPVFSVFILGTAGYGNNSWAVGQSYADMPVLTPVLYDPSAAAGSRWSRSGISPSTVPRMYHSSATLLPDGRLFVFCTTIDTTGFFSHRLCVCFWI
jgi:hypothetical protein